MELSCILLLCFASSVLASYPCGTKATNQLTESSGRDARYIIGGISASKGDWPWQVYLDIRMRHNTKSRVKCGGNIVCRKSDKSILSAKNVFVTAGIANETEVNPNEVVGHRVRSAVLEIFTNNFNHDTTANDIALLKLEQPLIFNDHISAICLPNLSQPVPENGNAVVTGFGYSMRTVEGNNRMVNDGLLQQASIPIVNCENLEKSSQVDNVPRSGYWNNLICAGMMTNTTSMGDSGGPLMMKSGNRKWFQICVVSFGQKRNAEGVPIPANNMPDKYASSKFTDVRKYCNWIETTTNGDAKCHELAVQFDGSG